MLFQHDAVNAIDCYMFLWDAGLGMVVSSGCSLGDKLLVGYDQ